MFAFRRVAILIVMSDLEPRTVNAMAVALDLHRATIASQVHDMAAAGLLSRTPLTVHEWSYTITAPGLLHLIGEFERRPRHPVFAGWRRDAIVQPESLGVEHAGNRRSRAA